ncbi:MAG TPA: hypothetical protein VFB14_28305 [Bryobacteraceae bacterium]|jgi:hypothetical protein|nr:hypothetical protein [Bryobacteraceae bacterium]
MPRRLLCAFLALATVSLLLAGRPKTNDDPVFAKINSIVKTLSEISGLSQEHPVAYGRMSKKQLRQFLAKRIKRTLKPDEIHADEVALKMFGLVPQDFDLRKSTIDLLTEQAAAFYDYDAKKLFLLEDSSVEEETTSLAHELSHALADQHFNLERFMDESPASDDENLAHTAVVEGQASWLMIAYDLKQAGQPPVPTPEMLKTVAGSDDDTSMGEYPVLKGSPLYIQQSLLFPYTAGILFFDAVYKKMGNRAFSEVFIHPPLDSSQIMHPERYFAHQKPLSPELPKLALKNQGKQLTDGTVGEFDHEMLLWQYLGQAKATALAPHLRGGNFKVIAAGKQHKPVLEYVSVWDSPEQATNFFAAYEQILHRKWKHCDVSTSNSSTLAGTGDDGYFVAHRTGSTVSSVEGLSDIDDWQRLQQEPAARASARMFFLRYTDEWSFTP